jgi:3-hydroxyisobutyrate dehydrogenase
LLYHTSSSDGGISF